MPARADTNSALRYFEGELVIDKVGGMEACQRHIGSTKDVQITWQENRKGGEPAITGWIVFAGGAPGKLEGATPAELTVATNYHDAHLNTPTTLRLQLADGKASGSLRETPATLGFGETMCFWREARLTLTEKTGSTDVARRTREHAAWYTAHRHESRGDYHARYHQFAEAAAAYDQAIAVVDGVLPETRTYFKSLLNFAARHHEDAKGYEQAARRYRRLADISARQSELGVEDPALYHGWVRLATYLHFAKHNDEAITVIERAARLEGKAGKVDLDDRLLRLRLQGTIYVAAGMFDKAQASMNEEVALATAEAGPNDLRTFKARAQSARVFLPMKDHARFEVAFEPLAREITARYGEAHEFSRESNRLLGLHHQGKGMPEKARPWLEAAMRGYVALAESTAQALQKDEDARYVLALLLDGYIKQGIIAKNYVDRVKAGQASLEDLPFREPMRGASGVRPVELNPGDWDRLLKE
ncbi:MAG: hypothetical protein Q8M11_19360 [Sulfuritalea sp.]|nr:hypothetical protein [Sulfuritalea sp.]